MKILKMSLDKLKAKKMSRILSKVSRMASLKLLRPTSGRSKSNIFEMKTKLSLLVNEMVHSAPTAINTT